MELLQLSGKGYGWSKSGGVFGLLNLRCPLDVHVEMLSGKLDIVCSFTLRSRLVINANPSYGGGA